MRITLALLVTLAVACGDDDGPGVDAGGAADAGAATDTGPVACIEANGECTAEGSTCCDGLVCRTSSGGRAFCVTPEDTCFVGAEPGCCLDDAECEGEARCTALECRHAGDGVCKEPPPEGQCWTDRDCAGGARCTGAMICPCGASCIVADEPGTCG